MFSLPIWGESTIGGAICREFRDFFLKTEFFFCFLLKVFFDFFKGFRASSGRVLNFREERIRKFAHAGEKRKVEIFEFLRSFLKKRKSFEYNFSKSARIRSSFETLQGQGS